MTCTPRVDATATTPSTGSVSIAWDTALVADGSDTLAAMVVDATGNNGGSSAGLTVAN